MKRLVCLALTLVAIASAQLTGTKTISANGGNYPNITDAIAALNTDGVGAGGVIFVVKDGESFSIDAANTNRIIPTAVGSSLDKPIVFKRSGEGVKPVINIAGATGNQAIGFVLLGADYVTFDGLDIKCDAAVTNAAFLVQNASTTDGAKHNTIQNCDISMTAAGTAGVFQNVSAAITSEDGSNSYNSYIGNTSTKADYAIYLSNPSTVTTGYDIGNTIKSNVLSNFTGYGIYFKDQKNLTLDANTVKDYTATVAVVSNAAGIYGSGNFSTAILKNNKVFNLSGNNSSVYGIIITGAATAATGASYEIFNNQVGNISNSGTTYLNGSTSYYCSAYGIYTNPAYSTINSYNNLVYNIAATNVAYRASATGLYISGTGSNYKLNHNTVVMNSTTTVAANGSIAVYPTAGPASVDMSNNILINNGVPGSSAYATVMYYPTKTAPANLAASTDNNLLYAGTGVRSLLSYGHDATAPVFNATIAQHKAFLVNKDQNSISEAPDFILAPTDFRLNTQLSAFGKVLTPAITTDLNGFPRSVTTPTIGAYELGSSSITSELTNKSFDMLTNYPNPFNPETTIAFNLKNSTNVNVTVYNSRGQLVKQLLNTNLSAGNHSVKFNATSLNSGVYFYKLTTPENSLTQKMLLVK